MTFFIVGRAQSLLFCGFQVEKVLVEAQVLPGISSFSIVGMPAKCVVEARDRIRGAFYSSGFNFPHGRILVNLSPASAYKDGTHYDLPIALAILNSMKIVTDLQNCICLGELSLSGEITFSPGTLLAVQYAYKHSMAIVAGQVCAKEIAIAINQPKLFLGNNLESIVNNINHNRTCVLEHHMQIETNLMEPFTNVIGHLTAKRALCIAAAGKHHIAMVGPPGVGKSMLANNMPLLLPDLTEEEALEVTSVFSLAGLLTEDRILVRPPFRAPHCTSSAVALIGGSLPGEISLANKGILFLDEMPEFTGLDALRVPLESRSVTIARARSKFLYPCDFLLVAAMNPCKCGFLLEGTCVCGKQNYLSKISAPIMDRIDMKIYLSKPKMMMSKDEVPYASLVKRAREIQLARQNEYNAFVPIETLNNSMVSECNVLLQNYISTKNPSLRAINKIKRIARTIADLCGSRMIEKEHLQESMAFVSL